MEDKEYLDNPGEFFGEAAGEPYAGPEIYAEAETYAEACAEPGASLARVPNMAPVSYGNMNPRAIRRIESRMEEDAVNARAAARLSAELIYNVGTLATLGEQAARTAPGARKAIDHIINMYAVSHAQGLAERWALCPR